MGATLQRTVTALNYKLKKIAMMKEKRRPDGIFYDAIKMADCQCFFPKR